MATFEIRSNSVSATMTAHGEVSAIIRACDAPPLYTGDAGKAVAFLKALGVGASVEVRCKPDDGKGWRWIRSCMNKPALWADIMASAS